MLTLTIVIPVYNEERYLRACLESIAHQTIKPQAVIIVNNNSTDSSLKIAKSFKFTKVINQAEQGALFARNSGFDSAKTEIIGRIDADSRIPVNWVESVLQIFANSQISAVTGPVRGYDLPLPQLNWLPHHLLCQSLKAKHPFLFGFNMAVRRSAWQSVRGQLCNDRNLHEDLDLAIHLAKSGYELKYTKQLLSSASGRRYNDGLNSFHKYMQTYINTYRRHGYKDTAVYLAVATYWLGYLAYLPWTFFEPSRKNPMGI